jgi:hypothetical protein
MGRPLAFIESASPGIERLWIAVDGLPHVRLSSLDYYTETMAVSVVTLTDRQFFAPVRKPDLQE